MIVMPLASMFQMGPSRGLSYRGFGETQLCLLRNESFAKGLCLTSNKSAGRQIQILQNKSTSIKGRR